MRAGVQHEIVHVLAVGVADGDDQPVPGRDVDDAISMLRFAKQRASGMVEKVIRSAVANANERDVAPRGTLYVAKAWVDPGPIIKRFQPKDRGKAYPIKKRTSHLVVELGERE